MIGLDLRKSEAQIVEMQLSGFPLITIDPAICGGRPTITGTRVRVTDVLEMLASGASETDILEDFPYLNGAAIRASLNYAASLADHSVVIAAE